MKKIFLLMFAAAAALGSWAQSATISATATSDKLSVALTNESDNFVAFQMDIVLPAGVTVANDGKAVTLNDKRLTAADFSGTAIAGADNANFVIAYNVIDNTKVRVIAYNLENRALEGTEGELFSMAFSGTASDNFSVENVKFVTVDGLAEVDLKAVQSEAGNAGLIGDVNMDEEVDIYDLILLVQYVNEEIDIEDPDVDFSLENANVKADEDIDIFDITALVELINAEE